MKRNISILWLLTACVFFAGCEDNRFKNYVPGSVYLVKTGYQSEAPYMINEVETLTAWSVKSGLMGESCDVEYIFDEQIIADYNDENGTSYEMLPRDCYSVGEMFFHIPENGDDARFEVEYYPARILEYCDGVFSVEKYALPVRIEVTGMEATATEAIFCFQIKEPIVKIFSNAVFSKITEGEGEMVDVNVEVSLDYITDKDVPFTIETDEQALQAIADSYEEELDVKLIPASAYTMDSECVIKKGARSVSFIYKIDLSRLKPGMNVLPVNLKEVESPLKVDENNNTVFIPVQVMTDRTTQRYWASSTHADARYSKGLNAMFDNSWDTWWRALPGDADPTIIIDMGSEGSVGAVEIYTPLTGVPHPGDPNGEKAESVLKDINVYVSSSDDCWENVSSANWGESLLYYNWVSENPGNKPHSLVLPAGTTGRYVKVAMKKANNRITIYEVYAYR